MLGIPFLSTAILDDSGIGDSVRQWQLLKARLVLDGITREEHFRELADCLVQLLDGLIDRFRKTDLVSSPVLEITVDVIDKVDTEFLGIEAWQQAQGLPDKVAQLATIEAMHYAQSSLSDLRKNLRIMMIVVPQVHKNPALAFQFVDSTQDISDKQEEILKSLRELRKQIKALLKEL